MPLYSISMGRCLIPSTISLTAMNGVLRGLGVPVHPAESYCLFVGMGFEWLARKCPPADRRDEASVAACVIAMRKRYADSWAAKTRPYPGIPGLARSAHGVMKSSVRCFRTRSMILWLRWLRTFSARRPSTMILGAGELSAQTRS